MIQVVDIIEPMESFVLASWALGNEKHMLMAFGKWDMENGKPWPWFFVYMLYKLWIIYCKQVNI